MLSYEESLKILKETKALIDGHFILSSGLHSPRYVQCAQLLSKPKIASQICNSLAEKIKSSFKDFDLILESYQKALSLHLSSELKEKVEAEISAVSEREKKLKDFWK